MKIYQRLLLILLDKKIPLNIKQAEVMSLLTDNLGTDGIDYCLELSLDLLIERFDFYDQSVFYLLSKIDSDKFYYSLYQGLSKIHSDYQILTKFSHYPSIIEKLLSQDILLTGISQQDPIPLTEQQLDKVYLLEYWTSAENQLFEKYPDNSGLIYNKIISNLQEQLSLLGISYQAHQLRELYFDQEFLNFIITTLDNRYYGPLSVEKFPLKYVDYIVFNTDKVSNKKLLLDCFNRHLDIYGTKLITKRKLCLANLEKLQLFQDSITDRSIERIADTNYHIFFCVKSPVLYDDLIGYFENLFKYFINQQQISLSGYDFEIEPLKTLLIINLPEYYQHEEYPAVVLAKQVYLTIK